MCGGVCSITNGSKDSGSRKRPKAGNNPPKQLKTCYCSGETAYLRLFHLIMALSLINGGWGTEVQISTNMTPGARVLKCQVSGMKIGLIVPLGSPPYYQQ